MNNTQGGFYYKCPKTQMEINLQEFGDTEVVTIELLEATYKVSEDEIKSLEAEVQKLTDKYIKDIEKAVEEKSKEILTV